MRDIQLSFLLGWQRETKQLPLLSCALFSLSRCQFEHLHLTYAAMEHMGGIIIKRILVLRNPSHL